MMKKKAGFNTRTVFVLLFVFGHVCLHAQKNTTVEVDQGFPYGALNFVLTADEKYVVAWSHSSILKVYSSQTGRLVRSLGDHHTLVTAVTVNPWTGVLMSTDVDGNVIEWTTNLEVKKRYIKTSLVMPLDSRGYAEYYNVFYGAAHDFGIPNLVYGEKLKDLRYVNYDEGELRLNATIPAELYDCEKETWLSSPEVDVTPEYIESSEEGNTGTKGICEYSPQYFHLLNSESIKKGTFLKLKPYLQKHPGTSYHNIWPMNDTSRFIIGNWSGNPLVRKQYNLDPKDNFIGYVGFQRTGKYDTLTTSLRDTSGFSYLSASVYKPVMALRKKEKLRWIDLSNFNIHTFTVKEDNPGQGTPALDTSGNFITVSYKNGRQNRSRSTINVRTGKITADSSVFEVPTFLAKQLYSTGDPGNDDWEASSHERYLKNWFKNKTVKRYHFMGLDDGPYYFLNLPVDEYYRSGKTIPLVSSKEFVCPDLEGNLVLFDYPSERVKKKFVARGISLQIGIVPGTNLFFSQNTEGNVFFYNKSDKSGSGYTAAMYVSADGLCIINRDNYYYAHGRLNTFLFFNHNNETFLFEQFDLKYNRPDKVLQTFECKDTSLIRLYHNAYLKRLKKMGFTEEMLKEDFNLPEIAIKNQDRLPLVTDTASIALELAIHDEKYRLDRINLYINDVPVYGRNGIDLKKDSTQDLKRKVYAVLCEGKNKIQVSVLNQAGAESYKKTIYVTYKPRQTIKPNLYLVTIGDSRYRDNRYDLTYAAKDAADIQAAFENNGSYEKIMAFHLTNENVTREKILALKKELLGSKRDDVVMVSFAGHGVLDKDLNYYLATYDMDFDHPAEKGLAYEELEQLLDGIPALKKVLLLDACHSGEVDKEEVEQLAVSSSPTGEVKFRAAGVGLQPKKLGLKSTGELMGELFTDLRRGTGATVVSSASGVEYAMESDQWKNGLFTYCLLHGLKDRAADINGDGMVWLSELQAYLRTEVTKLSGGAQQPTSRIENLSLDFRIW